MRSTRSGRKIRLSCMVRHVKQRRMHAVPLNPLRRAPPENCCSVHADLVITHALEWPSLTVQWLPVSGPAAVSIVGQTWHKSGAA